MDLNGSGDLDMARPGDETAGNRGGVHAIFPFAAFAIIVRRGKRTPPIANGDRGNGNGLADRKNFEIGGTWDISFDKSVGRFGLGGLVLKGFVVGAVSERKTRFGHIRVSKRKIELCYFTDFRDIIEGSGDRSVFEIRLKGEKSDKTIAIRAASRTIMLEREIGDPRDLAGSVSV